VPDNRRLRLFFALWPDPAVREHLWQATRPAVTASAGRPVIRDNLHMTLAFLGSVDAELLPDVRAAAAGLQMPGFDFILDEMAFWARPGIVLAQPSEVPQALSELVGALWQALEPLPLAARPGRYRPHVSLARKAKRPLDLALQAPLSWCVREFFLARSITDPAGARYEPLARYHLIQAGGGSNRT